MTAFSGFVNLRIGLELAGRKSRPRLRVAYQCTPAWAFTDPQSGKKRREDPAIELSVFIAVRDPSSRAPAQGSPWGAAWTPLDCASQLLTEPQWRAIERIVDDAVRSREQKTRTRLAKRKGRGEPR